MPEGHSIHRYARLHRDMLGGRAVAAWSPQGRFAAGAGAIDGATLTGVDAHGKHLFYRFATAPPDGGRLDRGHPFDGRGPDLSLHVHLGLFGRFRHYMSDPAPPTPGTRLVLAADSVQVRLAGPTACELIDPAVEDALRSRLGPDPLNDDSPAPAWAALRRRTAPVGQVLLDQRVVSGVGNVYRAEVLFLAGIDPDRSARAVSRSEFDHIWSLLRRLLRDGERRGRIVTVQPGDRTRPPSRLRNDERLYVYKRTGQPCRRCATPIRSWELAARLIFACPICQPA